ncbi:MAG: mannose-1-phosphate guanylyltransferase [Planctomycetia bacterium]|nr:mannose-1-phosphate guanylyltransferase [Planctomycetia bacterium]
MLHAIIMAGGSGTRLWPESRKNRPKQLLRLEGERSFLQQTVDRLSPLVERERIRIFTGKNLRQAVEEQVPELGAEGVVVEPCARNTAACIALAAILCLEQDPDATMVVLPCDHVISPAEEFRETLRAAAHAVDTSPESLLTLGIRPTSPSEAFGYIERSQLWQMEGEIPIFQVSRFREKPSRETAAEYLATGRFFWNAGIFVWRATTILEQLRRHSPGVYEPTMELRAALQESSSRSLAFQEKLATIFPTMESIAMDYAVLEPAAAAGEVLMAAAPFQWDDAGTWSALERLFPHDDAGNTILCSVSSGEPILLETHDCLIRSTDSKRRVVCFGVADLGILVLDDVVLVFDKHREESIRKITQVLRERGLEELL